MDNCYLPTADPDASGHPPELAPQALETWLAGLVERGMCATLVSIFLKLERMTDAPIHAAQRIAVLYRLMPAIRDLADDLPKDPPAAKPGYAREPQSLQQRLICLTVKNLKAALQGLDSVNGTEVPGRDAARLWAVQCQFEWLGRQILLCARWGRPWPRQTWQELHDLYAYWLDRLASGTRAAESQSTDSESFDAVQAYKRLLLVGLISASGASGLLAPAWSSLLDIWATESVLLEAGPESLATGSYLVELSFDSPPRKQTNVVDTLRRALVLRTPRQLEELLAEAAAGRPLYLPT